MLVLFLANSINNTLYALYVVFLKFQINSGTLLTSDSDPGLHMISNRMVNTM